MQPYSELVSIAREDIRKQGSVDGLDNRNVERSLPNLARRYHSQWLP